MSQRAEKYARSVERRTGALEERADKLEESRAETGKQLAEYGNRLEEIEENMEHRRVVYAALREHERSQREQENRRQRREIERDMDSQRRGLVIAIVLAIVALIVAVNAAGTDRAEETAIPAAAVTTSVEADLLATGPVEVTGPWEFAALYRAAEDPEEKQRIGEALEGQGYFSAAVPMCCEYQDYMRTYCRDYCCPYPLALAVAEVESNFDMETVGAVGEAGIMQLNPGPNGAYHAELEAATGLDPTTPEGNIAGGCYLLGKYLAEYEDLTMAAMAYSMGQAGAQRAREAGRSSTTYTDAVLEAMAQWECEVNAWEGE